MKKNKAEQTNREEEVKMQKALMQMYHSGDPDLKEEAIIQLWDMLEQFVWYAMKKWYPTFYSVEESREELFSCCKIAFLSEIGKFDPEQGTLSTFFTFPFKHEMYEWINKETHDASGYHSKMMQQVQNAIRELQSLGADVTPAAISHVCGLSVKKVNQTLERIEAKNAQSLNTDEQLEEVIKGNSKSPEELFLEAEATETIASALRGLSEQDRTAIVLYFGLDGGGSRSYNAVAKQMKISPPQAQTSIARGLHILRNDKSLKVMFGKGATNYRQRQLDTIEISLVTNENFIQAYDALDEVVEEKPATSGSTTTVLLTF